MIDVDDTLRSELNRLVPIDSRRDWAEVVARSGLKRERARRWWALGAVIVIAAVAIGVATPLGAAIGRGLDDFSAWLTGEPGTPASESEQREFEAANARSWLGFPRGTKLRHLITDEAGDTTVTLFGFRSGSSLLCLRLRVTGGTEGTTMSCAPLAELRRAGGPARAVIADFGLGKGDKTAWYGIDLVGSPKLSITAGIAADAIRSVVLEDDSGRHAVPVESNAFLYVAERPDVGQRVSGIWARTDDGLVAVPFAPTPFGVGAPVPSRAAPAPPEIDRQVEGGRIKWLEAREPRGEPLDVLPSGEDSLGPGFRRNVLFGRVLTPDPDRPTRIVLTLNAHQPDGPPAGLCPWLVGRGSGAGGGCTPYPFAGTPILSSGFMAYGFNAFVTVSGVASDDVDRIDALLADGQRAEVPLVDNVFVVDLPRANLPARLVAYDEEDRVIGVDRPLFDFGAHFRAQPARGRARSLIRVEGYEGATAELFVGPASDGGECVFIKQFVDRQHAGNATNCHEPTWNGSPLQVGTSWSPPHFVSGRVRSDVKTVRIRLADGSAVTVTPTRGHILWAVPSERREPVSIVGLDKDGTVLGRQSLLPPEPTTRSRRSSSQD
jgi:hypothetical protein